MRRTTALVGRMYPGIWEGAESMSPLPELDTFVEGYGYVNADDGNSGGSIEAGEGQNVVRLPLNPATCQSTVF